jgi:hypothetical protein
MTEAEYRERAVRGEFLSEAERRTLVDVEQMLYSTAYWHWDVAACFFPLCVAHRVVQRAVMA